jgi:hypothetical protein
MHAMQLNFNECVANLVAPLPMIVTISTQQAAYVKVTQSVAYSITATLTRLDRAA